MDPLSAISVAGTVVQYVDFTAKLLSSTRDFYKSQGKSGSTNKQELKFIIADLEAWQSKLAALKASSDNQTGSDLQLTALCNECQSITESLLLLLRKQERAGSRLKQSFIAQSQQKEVDRLTDRLAQLKRVLDDVTISQLYKQSVEQSVLMSNRFEELNRQTQTIVKALVASGQELSNKELQDQSVAISQLTSGEDHRGPYDLLNASAQAPLSTLSPEAIQRTEQNLRVRVKKGLLDHLSFPVMTDRWENIMESYTNTCEWIFDTDGSDATSQKSNFSDWLSKGSGLYWITGKAGSGKSTMMKHVYQSKKTREALKLWAKSEKLMTAAFFFWNSGSALERSQDGLLRSLLYTVLEQQSELLAVVMPHRWALLYSSLATPNLNNDPQLIPWTQKELKEAFRKLISQDLVPLKLFLLVDGLDEYDGDQADIVALFEDMSGSKNVKAVVSARPLPDFKKSIETGPSASLAVMNHDDIKRYVRATLENEPALDPVSSLEIANEITKQADGSFLWATLVAPSFRKGLANGDSIETLRERFLKIEVPEDDSGSPEEHDPPSPEQQLNAVYDKLLADIPSTFKVEAAQVLQIILAMSRIRKHSTYDGEEPLSLIELALAEGKPEDAIEAKMFPWNYADIQRHCTVQANKLKAQLPGFIVVVQALEGQEASTDPGSIIQFSHRATREYMEGVGKTKLLEVTTTTPFNPYISLIKSFVQHLKILERPQPREILWSFVIRSLRCAHHFEADAWDETLSSVYIKLLVQLDQSMEQHHVDALKDRDGKWIERKFVLETLVKSDEGWGSKMDASLHWTNFHPKYSQPRNWNNTFLSLAVQFGLSKFVAKSLGSGDKILKSKKGRPLLDYAIQPLPGLEYELITYDLVKVLLDHGANPNQKFGTTTCWQNALLWQCEHFHSVDGKLLKSPEAQNVAEIRLKIFHLLLKYEADAHAWCDPPLPHKKGNPASVLEEYFKLCETPHIEEVRKTLIATVKANKLSFGNIARRQKTAAKAVLNGS